MVCEVYLRETENTQVELSAANTKWLFHPSGNVKNSSGLSGGREADFIPLLNSFEAITLKISLCCILASLSYML